jgi:hypothetical protein
LRLTIVSSDDSNRAGATFGQISSGSETNIAGETDKGSAEEAAKRAAVESNNSNNEGNSAAEEKALDSIKAMYAALRACWVPPPKDTARHGMQYTIRFAFKRDGEIVAPPRVTYASHDAPAEVRDVYRDAVNAALARCTPLHLSEGMGAPLLVGRSPFVSSMTASRKNRSSDGAPRLRCRSSDRDDCGWDRTRCRNGNSHMRLSSEGSLCLRRRQRYARSWHGHTGRGGCFLVRSAGSPGLRIRSILLAVTETPYGPTMRARR